MYTVPVLDPVGSIIAELRADSHVAALVGTRVRGGQPAEEDQAGPTDWRAFIVVVTLDEPPHVYLPILRGVYAVNCYGVTFQNARAVWGAVVKAMHRKGPREKGNGLGIFDSVAETGGEQDTDPDTGQPVVRGTLRLNFTGASIAGL